MKVDRKTWQTDDRSTAASRCPVKEANARVRSSRKGWAVEWGSGGEREELAGVCVGGCGVGGGGSGAHFGEGTLCSAPCLLIQGVCRG